MTVLCVLIFCVVMMLLCKIEHAMRKSIFVFGRRERGDDRHKSTATLFSFPLKSTCLLHVYGTVVVS